MIPNYVGITFALVAFKRTFLIDKKGLEALNNSIFKDFIEFCSLKEQLILAFSLGFFNKHPFNSKDVADIFNINEISVINLTHECLIFTRNRLEQKDKTKVKSSSH